MALKVALVTYGMLGGGIETYLINLGCVLKNKGMDVTVVTTEVPGAWFERLRSHGIKSKYIDGLDLLLPPEHILKVNKVLRQDGYDVIFLNHARYAQAAIDLLDENTVVIPVLHGNDDVFYNISSYKSDLCNCIVAVSPRLANVVIDKKPKCPVVTIPNGIQLIDTSKFKQRTFYEKQIRLIYVGRLYHKEKGIFLIPDILRRLKECNIDVFLDIVGDGNDRDEFIGMLKDKGVLDKIHMWGTLGSQKVYELLCKSHFLLFPSFTEGLPCVPIEAQMCGCIPIASKLSGSTDVIIKDGETGILVDIGDIDGICKAVVALWQEREHAKLMSIEASRYSRENFSVEAMGKKYYDLIIDAISGKYLYKEKREGSSIVKKLNAEQLLEKHFDILFISGTDEVKSMHKFWMKQMIVKQEPISGYLYKLGIRRAAIFGTLKDALYLLKDLSMAGIEVISFLDNNLEMQGKILCNLPVNSSSWLVQHTKEIDIVVVSIESESDVFVKEQLQKLTTDSAKVLSWKDLVRLNGFIN